MFVRPGVRDLTNLHDLIEGGEKNFDAVISDNTFLYLWNIGQQTIVNYVMNTFDLVLANAFYLKKKTNPLVTKRCIALLTSPGALPYSDLIKNSNFLPFMMELPQHIFNLSIKTQSAYFMILRQVLGNKLYPRLANTDFLTVIIKLSPINECYNYTNDLINSKDKDTIKLLKKLNFIDILVKEIASSEESITLNSPNPMRLFIKSLSTTYAADAQRALQKGNVAAKIIDNILERPHPEGIEFLRYLIQLGAGRLFNGWHFIIANIRGRIPDVYKLLMDSPSFTVISDSCVSLLTSYIIATKSFDENAKMMFTKLSNDFFNYPTNSFLHIRYVKLLQALNRKKLLSNSIIKESNLYENTLNAYKNKSTALAVYYGQLGQIVHIITPKLRSLPGYDSKQWAKIALAEVKSAEKIKSRRYGGRLPLAKGSCGILVIVLIALAVLVLIIVLIRCVVKARIK